MGDVITGSLRERFMKVLEDHPDADLQYCLDANLAWDFAEIAADRYGIDNLRNDVVMA